MVDEEDSSGPSGEIRVKTEGGIAHFPGLAREKVIPFEQLRPDDRREIARLAEEAQYFSCGVSDHPPRPDARTTSLCLTIDGRYREMRVSEPLDEGPLSQLLAKVRQLSRA